MFDSKWFWICGFSAVCGNILVNIYLKNISAIIGWIVALLWFPYDNLNPKFTKHNYDLKTKRIAIKNGWVDIIFDKE